MNPRETGSGERGTRVDKKEVQAGEQESERVREEKSARERDSEKGRETDRERETKRQREKTNPRETICGLLPCIPDQKMHA